MIASDPSLQLSACLFVCFKSQLFNLFENISYIHPVNVVLDKALGSASYSQVSSCVKQN